MSLKKSLAIILLVLFAGFMIVTVLASCSAEKQYKRLIKKHPEFVLTDTVIVKDTVIREIKVPVLEYRDSFIIKHDTTIETKKLIIYKKGDFFGVTVKPDTITYRDTLPIEVIVPGKVVEIEKPFNYNLIWILLVIGFLLGILVKKR